MHRLGLRVTLALCGRRWGALEEPIKRTCWHRAHHWQSHIHVNSHPLSRKTSCLGESGGLACAWPALLWSLSYSFSRHSSSQHALDACQPCPRTADGATALANQSVRSCLGRRLQHSLPVVPQVRWAFFLICRTYGKGELCFYLFLPLHHHADGLSGLPGRGLRDSTEESLEAARAAAKATAVRDTPQASAGSGQQPILLQRRSSDALPPPAAANVHTIFTAECGKYFRWQVLNCSQPATEAVDIWRPFCANFTEFESQWCRQIWPEATMNFPRRRIPVCCWVEFLGLGV